MLFSRKMAGVDLLKMMVDFFELLHYYDKALTQ